MSLFTTPSFINLAIVNGIGFAVFFLLTLMSVWFTTKSETKTNPLWSAILMSLAAIALAVYNGFNAYLAYNNPIEDTFDWVLLGLYMVLAFVFFTLIFGSFSTTKVKNAETVDDYVI